MADKKSVLGILSVIATMNVSPFIKASKKGRKGLANFADGAVTSMAKIGLAIDGARKAIDLLSTPLALSADLEQTAVSFEVLLGSAEKSKDMMESLRDFAASTPFQFPEISSSAKKLIAFGQSADSIVPTLTRLGNLSAGLGVPFEDLANLFGKARVAGRVMTEDLNQFSERGINVMAILAEKYGVTTAEVRNMASQGKLSFADLEYSIKKMTDEGGQFFGLMAKQSKTLGGVWSTLKDNVSMVLTDLGDELVKTFDLKNSINNFTKYVQGAKPAIVEFVKSLAPLGESILQGVINLSSGFATLIQGIAPLVSVLADLAKYLGVGGPILVGLTAIIATGSPFLAITAGAITLLGYLNKLEGQSRSVLNVMEGYTKKQQEQRAADQSRMNTLTQLSKADKLNSDQMSEAENIITSLTDRYGNLGLSIDKTTGKITGATNAQEKLNQAFRQQAISDTQREIANSKNLLRELNEAQESVGDSILSTALIKGDFKFDPKKDALSQVFSVGDKERAAIQKKINAEFARLQSFQKDLERMQNGTGNVFGDEKVTSPVEEIIPPDAKALDYIAKLKSQVADYGKTKAEIKFGILIPEADRAALLGDMADLQAQLDVLKIDNDLAPKTEKFAKELDLGDELVKTFDLKNSINSFTKYIQGAKPAIVEFVKSLAPLGESILQGVINLSSGFATLVQGIAPLVSVLADFDKAIKKIKFETLPDHIQTAMEKAKPALEKFKEGFKDLLPFKEKLEKAGAWEIAVNDLKARSGIAGERAPQTAVLARSKEAADILANRSTIDPTIEIQNKLLDESIKQTEAIDEWAEIVTKMLDNPFGAKDLTPKTDPFAPDTTEFDNVFGEATIPEKDPFRNDTKQQGQDINQLVKLFGVAVEELKGIKETNSKIAEAPKPELAPSF